jgi:hypothetical protein
MEVQNTEVLDQSAQNTAPVETPAAQPVEVAPEVGSDASVTEKPKTFDDIEKFANGESLVKDPKAAKVASQVGDVAQTPAYTPSFKYKVYGEEKELDPRLKSLVKTKEDEEWITKIMSKADGIEGVTTQRDLYRNSYQQIKNQGDQILSMVDKGDYAGVLSSLGAKPSLEQLVDGLKISDDELIRFAYQRATLTPEQKQYYTQAKSLEAQNRDLALQNQQHQELVQNIQIQQREGELSQALSTPDIAPIAQAFDREHGQGAFWEEVRQRGIAHFALHKVDAPVAQMVQQVASRLKVYAQNAAPLAQAQATPAMQSAPTPTKSPAELPVIPVVPTGGTSPARRKFKTFDEMERESNELNS